MVNPAADLTAAGPGAVTAWKQFVSDERLAPSTRRVYFLVAVKFLRWLQTQGVALTRTMPAVVGEFLESSEVTTATQSLYRTALRHLFGAFVAHGVVPDNSAASAPLAPDGSGATAPADETEHQAPVELYVRLDGNATEVRIRRVLTRTAADRLLRLIALD